MEKRSNTASTKFVIIANLFLIGIKLVVAILTGSLAVFAVLVDSLFDLMGSLIAYFGVKKGAEPPDADHLYGHKKYESLSSVAQLALITITAILIIVEALRRLENPSALPITAADLGIMLVTVAVDVVIVSYLKKKADAKSSAIQASIGNYTSDIMQNSMVIVGLAATWSGFLAADPIAALIVAFLMLRVVYNVGKGAFGELTDESPPIKQLERYARTIMAVPGVKSFHKLRARSVAGETKIDVHIQLSPSLSLVKSHQIATDVRAALAKKFPDVKEVLVHEEPYTPEHKRGPKFGS